MMKRMCPLGRNDKDIHTAERRDTAYKQKRMIT